MDNAYIITNFYLDTDIDLGYLLEKRYIYYSENDLIYNLKDLIEIFYEEYIEKTGIDYLSFDDFYNKFNLILEVSIISLNHRNILTETDYENYLEEVKTVSEEDLCDYLISYTDNCILEYDHKLNIKSTYTHLTNVYNPELFVQFSFSYKALFPDKYHMNKYKDGDRVLYNGEEYIIWKNINPKYSIYEADNPLNYIIGYTLFDDNGYILNDDKWCYFPMDEDLELLPINDRYISNDQIECIKRYICSSYNKNNVIYISNTPESNEYRKYNKLIRSDDYISVILELQDGNNIEITKKSSIDLMSYTFLYDDNPVMYNIGYILIDKECYIKRIIVKYNNIEIDSIYVNSKYCKNDAINISKYLRNRKSFYKIVSEKGWS